MLNSDISCKHCQFYASLSHNGSWKWECGKFGKQIDQCDPSWSVCRVWKPDPGFFPEDLLHYFSETGSLSHLKSKELYRTFPELDLMPLA
jgi:hypothetical protein